jgi:hypothetical protein
MVENLTISSQGPPGFLLQPLGWLNGPLAKILEAEPRLLGAVFRLEPSRMHLIAMRLAHDLDLSPALLRALSSESLHTAVVQAIGHCPSGLGRVLGVLPNVVLPPACYRTLVSLLSNQAVARYLCHRRSIDEQLIVGLAALPEPLQRSSIFELFDRIEGMDGFMDGLKLIAVRGAIDLEMVIQKLSLMNQGQQVLAYIASLVDELPLVDSLPCSEIGPFRRVDSVAEIRNLAKSWSNCLADYLQAINDCTGAVYASAEHDSPAVALVFRVDRLGWAVNQIKGRENVDLRPAQASRYQNIFRSAGISMWRDTVAVKTIALRARWSRHAFK